ncbi:MAG: hypothetical protein LBI03_04190 [Clostridiales bacterium]|nr:hypothetical protein [Clostridiales bacterium]
MSKHKNNNEKTACGYTHDELMTIGCNIASLWGGECFDYDIDEKKEIVIFHCIEHGEMFDIETPFSDLEKEEIL